MKWIGQHIYDLTSRFRSDVYLEDISTGTIASGAHLGLDSNNKIVKAVDGGGDLTSIVAGTGLSGTNLTGPIPTLNVDASQTQITSVGTIGTGVWQGTAITAAYIAAAQTNITSLGTLTDLTVDNVNINGDTITASGDLAIVATGNDISVDTDNFVITSATDQRPFLELKNTTNSTKGSKLQFTKDKGAAGADSDIIGLIDFMGDDAAQTQTLFARINVQVSEADDTDEAGKLTLSVTNDGTLRNGITMEGSKATTAEVDVTIANGAASVTTLAGTLTMGSTAAMTNAGLLSVANQSNITGLGTISSGVWNGTAINQTYLTGQSGTNTGDETLSSINGLGVTTVGTIDTGVWQGTAIATNQQKHLATFDIRGYSTADGTNYEIPVFVTDNNAPFEHNTSAGSDGLTALAITKLIRATGVVMPYAGTLKKWKGWSTHSTTSGTCNIALFRYRPVAGNSSAVSLVLLDAVGHTPAGNSKVIDIEQTSFTDADVAEGDIIISGIKGDGSQVTYFVSTLEIEWD
jgi:hypothetical protein